MMNSQIKNLVENNKDLEVSLKKNLKFVIDRLNKNQIKICFILDNKKLVGSITDGDIRRSILKNISKETPVKKIMNKNPLKFFYSEKNIPDKLMKAAKKKKIYIFPIVDKKNNYQGYVNYNNKYFDYKSNSNLYDVVIMAGGFGKRLRPLTINKPKPLIKVDGKPILHRIISKIDNINVNKIYITLHYKSRAILKFLKTSGLKKIIPVIEKKPKDTFGSLLKIKNKLNKNILVINSDIITNLDTADLFEFHRNNNADLTICGKKNETKVNFGVIKTNGKKIYNIDEKPILNYWINTGIYFLKKNCIPNSKKIKINAVELINSLINKKFRVILYPMYETWFDIGTHEQLELADKFLKKHKK